MWYYVQCDLVVVCVMAVMVMAKPYTRLSGVTQEQSIFKSEFSSLKKWKKVNLSFLILMLDGMKSNKT